MGHHLSPQLSLDLPLGHHAPSLHPALLHKVYWPSHTLLSRAAPRTGTRGLAGATRANDGMRVCGSVFAASAEPLNGCRLIFFVVLVSCLASVESYIYSVVHGSLDGPRSCVLPSLWCGLCGSRCCPQKVRVGGVMRGSAAESVEHTDLQPASAHMNTNDCTADHPDSIPSLFIFLLIPLSCSGKAVSVSARILHVRRVRSRFF